MRSRNLFSNRLKFVGVVCVVLALGIFSKMAHLTLVRGATLLEQGLGAKCKDKVRMAYRGSIVDRTGAALATTTAASRVSRERPYVYDPTHAAALGPLLDLDVEELDQRLAKGGDGFLWLSKGVDIDATRAIRRLKIPGIGFHNSQRRSYPQGSTAAHVIGFTGADAKGLEGIELKFEEEIRGEPVSVQVCTDAHRQAFLSRGDLAGVNKGATIDLTIDATLQTIAEAELAAQVEETGAVGGAVVILDPNNGDILAMANAPTFDPNNYGRSGIASRRNRAVTDLFEPGSTMKPIVIAAALDAGTIQPDQKFFCENGRLLVPGWRKAIRDHHPYGELDVEKILQVSSNICTAKIGFTLGPKRMHEYLDAFGFHRKTGIPLPGEARGLLLPPEEWKQIHTATISFGQGISVNPLQLASAFGTLANDGVRMKPRIVRQVIDQYGSPIRAWPAEEESQVVAPEVARSISKMLESVVLPGGTARQAYIEGVSVAGKTGTAQKAENGGYSLDRWLASFVGFLPADDPKIVIAVLVDEPKGVHYGGVVAGPVFKRIAERSLDYLGIPRALPKPEASEDLPIEVRGSKSDGHAVQEEITADMEAEIEIPEGAMPDLKGLSLRAAFRALQPCDVRIRVEGSGYVTAQIPEPGLAVDSIDEVVLTLSREL